MSMPKILPIFIGDHYVAASGLPVLIQDSAGAGKRRFAVEHPTRYFRRFDLGWGDQTSQSLHPDDALVLQLQGAAVPLRLRDVGSSGIIFPIGGARPAVAVPMLVRNQLVGVVFYGPHTSGAELDADELHSIEMLVQSAASANDHLEAEALRAKVAELSAALLAAGLTV